MEYFKNIGHFIKYCKKLKDINKAEEKKEEIALLLKCFSVLEFTGVVLLFVTLLCTNNINNYSATAHFWVLTTPFDKINSCKYYNNNRIKSEDKEHKMKVLLLGGNQFLGRAISQKLIDLNCDLYLLNRGSRPNPEEAKFIKSDRNNSIRVCRRFSRCNTFLYK